MFNKPNWRLALYWAFWSHSLNPFGVKCAQAWGNVLHPTRLSCFVWCKVLLLSSSRLCKCGYDAGSDVSGSACNRAPMLHRRCLLILLNCSRTFTEALSKLEKSTRSTHLTSSCNINQTIVCFDMPRSKTNDVIAKKDISIKTKKGGCCRPCSISY